MIWLTNISAYGKVCVAWQLGISLDSSLGMTCRGVVPFTPTGYIRYGEPAPRWGWLAADCRRYSGHTMFRVGTVHPQRFYSERGGRHNSRPYSCNTIHPHGLYTKRSRNGTQAVPYGFADWCIFPHNVFKSGHLRHQ